MTVREMITEIRKLPLDDQIEAVREVTEFHVTTLDKFKDRLYIVPDNRGVILLPIYHTSRDPDNWNSPGRN